MATKRPREGANGETAAMVTGCSPHRWQLESPASKRVRAHAEAVVAATGSSTFMPAEAGARWRVDTAAAGRRARHRLTARRDGRHVRPASHFDCLCHLQLRALPCEPDLPARAAWFAYGRGSLMCSQAPAQRLLTSAPHCGSSSGWTRRRARYCSPWTR